MIALALLAAGPLPAITLEALAAKSPIAVRTVQKGEAVDLGADIAQVLKASR